MSRLLMVLALLCAGAPVHAEEDPDFGFSFALEYSYTCVRGHECTPGKVPTYVMRMFVDEVTCGGAAEHVGVLVQDEIIGVNDALVHGLEMAKFMKIMNESLERGTIRISGIRWRGKDAIPFEYDLQKSIPPPGCQSG